MTDIRTMMKRFAFPLPPHMTRLASLVVGVFGLIAAGMGVFACGAPKSIEVDEVLSHLEDHLGKQITIRSQFKSGARCRQTGETWQTYCGSDCQVCRGPLVVDSKLNLPASNLNDWPMILGGTYKGRDIRCKGPLNNVECYPFELGKPYVVRGTLERNHPPRLIVSAWWPVEDDH
ncbi:MAG: hypothetical protein H6729_07735 [Deltaproteobacteria bacterium]|nr:hypothetical protein [Deltaproteobacteria bacterium]